MAKITILGSANAISDKNHENTHLLIHNQERVVLVDCAGNPIPGLKHAKIQPDQVSDLVLTHFHPDHVAGAPLLMMDLWLMGRTRPLTVHGLDHTISRLQVMMDLYDWKLWPNFFPVIFNIIPEAEKTPVIHDNDFLLSASPVNHLLPTIGIRLDIPSTQKAAAYSSDTEPCETMVRLAESVDILIHEAAGDSMGHSSAQQAGEIAQKSKAKSLYLIHYPLPNSQNQLIQAAKESYTGSVYIAQDFMEITL
jgi:ribonuclease Z